MLSILLYVYWPSVCFLWTYVYSDPLTIFKIALFINFFLKLSCMSSLYILDIDPLGDASFENTFSHSVCCLFILLMVSFTAKAFQFHVTPFVLLCFCCSCLRRQIRKVLLRLMSDSLLLVFSPRSFVVSCLTCKSLFSIFYYMWYEKILLRVAFQFSQHHLLNRLFFPHCVFLVLQSRIQFSHSAVYDSLRPHELQHTRPSCLSPIHGVYSNSCPSSR